MSQQHTWAKPRVAAALLLCIDRPTRQQHPLPGHTAVSAVLQESKWFSSRRQSFLDIQLLHAHYLTGIPKSSSFREEATYMSLTKNPSDCSCRCQNDYSHPEGCHRSYELKLLLQLLAELPQRLRSALLQLLPGLVQLLPGFHPVPAAEIGCPLQSLLPGILQPCASPQC